jgi:hypothetical protein
LAQDVVVAAQAAQLLALGGGQLAGPTTAGIDVDLVQPVAQGLPGDAEILGQLGMVFPLVRASSTASARNAAG